MAPKNILQTEILFFQTFLKKILPELKVEVSEDIRAASITAISIPRIPGGKIRSTKVGYAIFEHATELLQAF